MSASGLGVLLAIADFGAVATPDEPHQHVFYRGHIRAAIVGLSRVLRLITQTKFVAL